jgi:hypothetical protein
MRSPRATPSRALVLLLATLVFLASHAAFVSANVLPNAAWKTAVATLRRQGLLRDDAPEDPTEDSGWEAQRLAAEAEASDAAAKRLPRTAADVYYDDAMALLAASDGTSPRTTRTAVALLRDALASDPGAFYLTLVPVRPRRRGERRFLRTFSPGGRFSPPTPRFQSRHTSLDAFQLRF